MTTWLFVLLADLADQYADRIVFTLRTVCVTAMNDDGTSSCGSPIVRGLALNCQTGHVTMAKCCGESDWGPASTLRLARLWTTTNTEPQLRLIHSQLSDTLTVQPFVFQPWEGIEVMVKLPDEVLLQYSSTSPDCEDEDFCTSVRQTLSYVLSTPCTSVFGAHCDKPLHFRRRTDNTNSWSLVQ